MPKRVETHRSYKPTYWLEILKTAFCISWATLKAGTVEWWNGGKWPQILKHGTAENDPKA